MPQPRFNRLNTDSPSTPPPSTYQLYQITYTYPLSASCLYYKHIETSHSSTRIHISQGSFDISVRAIMQLGLSLRLLDLPLCTYLVCHPCPSGHVRPAVRGGSSPNRKGRPYEIQIWNQTRIKINWFLGMLCWIHASIPAIFMYVLHAL